MSSSLNCVGESCPHQLSKSCASEIKQETIDDCQLGKITGASGGTHDNSMTIDAVRADDDDDLLPAHGRTGPSITWFTSATTSRGGHRHHLPINTSNNQHIGHSDLISIVRPEVSFTDRVLGGHVYIHPQPSIPHTLWADETMAPTARVMASVEAEVLGLPVPVSQRSIRRHYHSRCFDNVFQNASIPLSVQRLVRQNQQDDIDDDDAIVKSSVKTSSDILRATESRCSDRGGSAIGRTQLSPPATWGGENGWPEPPSLRPQRWCLPPSAALQHGDDTIAMTSLLPRRSPVVNCESHRLRATTTASRDPTVSYYRVPPVTPGQPVNDDDVQIFNTRRRLTSPVDQRQTSSSRWQPASDSGGGKEYLRQMKVSKSLYSRDARSPVVSESRFCHSETTSHEGKEAGGVRPISAINPFSALVMYDILLQRFGLDSNFSQHANRDRTDNAVTSSAGSHDDCRHDSVSKVQSKPTLFRPYLDLPPPSTPNTQTPMQQLAVTAENAERVASVVMTTAFQARPRQPVETLPSLSVGGLLMTSLSMTRPQTKKYRCDLCGRIFSRSNTLVTHRRIHTGEKPFACDLCGRAFRQPGNLTRHRLTHTTARPYPCNLCGKAFNRASNLQTHQRTHLLMVHHHVDDEDNVCVT